MAPVNPKVLESLNIGISSEIKSYVFYMEAAKSIHAAGLEETLLKLAGEEKEHYKILERQHHSLITSEQWVSYNDILKQTGLPEINEEMAETHKALIDSARSAKDKRGILEIALGLEKEAFDLFSKAADEATDDEEMKTFQFLAKFEMGHINLITGMIKSL
jgi:rubrerythrin